MSNKPRNFEEWADSAYICLETIVHGDSADCPPARMEEGARKALQRLLDEFPTEDAPELPPDSMRLKLPSGVILALETATGDMGLDISTEGGEPIILLPRSPNCVGLMIPIDMGPAEPDEDEPTN